MVCANCSPHRITIPRQYIVRAPEELRLSRAGLIDLIGEDDPSASRFDLYFNPALGGGEEVRVCNPVGTLIFRPKFGLPLISPFSVCLIQT